VYDDARGRVCALVAGLSSAQLDSTVPATPEWSARQVVAHLTGVAVDTVRGHREGAPGPSWTAPQVADREGRPLQEVVAEWAEAAPAVCAGIARREVALPVVHDTLTHEADLREAFGLGRLPVDVVDAALGVLVNPVVAGAVRDGALVVRAGGREWAAGAGEPTTVTVEAYELYRGLISRRSRRQMRAWEWAGDAERYVDALPVFGPRDDDQPLA